MQRTLRITFRCRRNGSPGRHSCHFLSVIPCCLPLLHRLPIRERHMLAAERLAHDNFRRTYELVSQGGGEDKGSFQKKRKGPRLLDQVNFDEAIAFRCFCFEHLISEFAPIISLDGPQPQKLLKLGHWRPIASRLPAICYRIDIFFTIRRLDVFVGSYVSAHLFFSSHFGLMVLSIRIVSKQSEPY